jgi:hypothetical protein
LSHLSFKVGIPVVIRLGHDIQKGIRPMRDDLTQLLGAYSEPMAVTLASPSRLRHPSNR